MRISWRKVLPIAALALGALALLAAAAPSMLAFYHTGAGARDLEAALDPVYVDRLAPEQLMDGERLNRALQHLHAALRYSPNTIHARRLLARAYVSTGELQTARELLEQAVELNPNPILKLELADVLDLQGEPAVELYEEGRVGSRALPLTANYLKQAAAYLASGSADVAIGAWQRTLELLPGNLAALAHLEAQHAAMGDTQRAERYRAQLEHFEPDAVAVPQDFRLAEAQAEAMAALVERGIWDRQRLQSVLAAQVWRHAGGLDGLMMERVLQTLLARMPDDRDLLFLRAELHQRRGELEQAAGLYQQVAALDPAYAPAALRLGALLPACGEGRGWLERYRALAPDDLLGLKLLRASYEACGEPVPTSLLEEASALLDPRSIAAELLGVAPETLSLGPNLLGQGGFETWDKGQPACWSWSDMSNKPPFAAAAFWGGAETLLPFAGTAHARVVRLWRVPPAEGEVAARAGYWYGTATEPCPELAAFAPGTVALFSAYYRTSPGSETQATAWLAEAPTGFWPGDRALPETDGAWWRLVAIARAGDGAESLRPLLRMFGTGELELDEVGLYAVEIAGEAELDEALMWASGEER